MRAILRTRRIAYGYTDLFGPKNFFLELQYHGLESDARVLRVAHRLASDIGIPLVATNDSHLICGRPRLALMKFCCAFGPGKSMSELNRMPFEPEAFDIQKREEMMTLFGEVEHAGPGRLRSRSPDVDFV